MTEEQKLVEEIKATIATMPIADRARCEAYAKVFRTIAESDGLAMLAFAHVGAEFAART